MCIESNTKIMSACMLCECRASKADIVTFDGRVGSINARFYGVYLASACLYAMCVDCWCKWEAIHYNLNRAPQLTMIWSLRSVGLQGMDKAELSTGHTLDPLKETLTTQL